MSLKDQLRKRGADPRQFVFGQRWVLNRDVIFVDAELYQQSHSKQPPKDKVRTVVILQGCPLNDSYRYPLVRIAPVTTDVVVKQPTDIPLYPDRDGVDHPCWVRLSHVQNVLKIHLKHVLPPLSEDAIREIVARELWILGQISLDD